MREVERADKGKATGQREGRCAGRLVKGMAVKEWRAAVARARVLKGATWSAR